MNSIHGIYSYIKDILYSEEWIIAIRKRANEFLFQNDGLQHSFQILRNTWRYWSADPFIFEKDGKAFLFFEMFDRLKGKGGIGVREFRNGEWSPMQMIIEKPFHMSFPYIYEDQNGIFMMPEASYDRCVPILKAVDFPWKWKKVERLLDGEKVCDSIMKNIKGIRYLFTQPVEKPYTFGKLDLYIESKEGWKLHPESPICKDTPNGARMAGDIFEVDGEIYRCGQDCRGGYGKGLCFFKIEKLNANEYIETYLKNISYNEIIVNAKEHFSGCHTYNISANFEVIDLKIVKCRPQNLLFAFIQKIKRLFR